MDHPLYSCPVDQWGIPLARYLWTPQERRDADERAARSPE
jgi:hypothetical protein